MSTSLKQGAIIQGEKNAYVIDKTLGQGSFGITYLAQFKTRLSGAMGSGYVTAQVCIKEFFMKDFNTRDEKTGSLNDTSGVTIVERYRKAFMREAKNLARMQHPGIVNVFEVIEANNTVYIVMEYIDGGSLDDYIHSKGRLSEVESLRCMLPICEAMDYMHRCRMLHLDMKPKNVMCDKEGHLYLIDFGLSKQYDANGEPESSTSIGLGTQGYAPLEQAEQTDDEHNFRATIDVYALGATLYKMLTGQTPPKATEVSSSVLDGDDLIRQNLTQIGVSEGLAQIVSKAMWPSSKKRVQSVAELLSCLTPAKPVDDVTIIEIEEDTEKEDQAEAQRKAEQERLRKEAEVKAAKEKAEAEARAKAEKERKAKAEAARKAREEAERQKAKASSASPSSESASKKPWLWGVAAVVALSLVWLIWPRSQTDVPPVDGPELVVNTADSIKAQAEQLAVDTKVETTKPEKKEEPKKEEIKQDEPVKTVEAKKEEPKKEEPKKEEPVRAINANGHDYVDLGLKDSKGRTIYWATCNVGASKPEDAGFYFAWGETKGYTSNTDEHSFDRKSYSLSGDANKQLIRYCTNSDYGTVDSKLILSLGDDAAHVNWGGDWRMPTKEEQDQLRTICKWTWDSAKKGSIVKGPNGNTIFLPAAGSRNGLRLFDADSGQYWSSTLNTNNSHNAWSLGFYSDCATYGDRSRCYGLSVRAVCVSSR